tara:strand:- start:4000 stop:7062 length:3063 start_codon:yes stop_codon:yes gene_type:complete
MYNGNKIVAILYEGEITMPDLVSPGVSVTVTDESFYAGASQGTVPLFVVASAKDKADPSTTNSTAIGTTSANVGKAYLIGSQRELLSTFGTPTFYSAGSTMLPGDERNEYGLLAAYSYLGISNRAFVVRADVDLAQLTGSTNVPAGTPNNGTYWLDTASTNWGVYQADGTNWSKKTPAVLTDEPNASATSNVNNDTERTPKTSYGANGDFVIVANGSNTTNGIATAKLWEKVSGTWYQCGADTWIAAKSGTPAVFIQPGSGSAPSAAVAGSVWIKSTAVGGGANVVVKYFSTGTNTWSTISAPLYADDDNAITDLKPAANSLYVRFDDEDDAAWDNDRIDNATYKQTANNSTPEVEYTIRLRGTGTTTTATGTADLSGNGIDLTGAETGLKINICNQDVTVTAAGGAGSNVTLAEIVGAINNDTQLAAKTVVASIEASSGTKEYLKLERTNGKNIWIEDTTTAGTVIGVTTATLGFTDNMASGSDSWYMASLWSDLAYEASANAPTTAPVDGTLWYDTNLTADLYVAENDGGTMKWFAYANSKDTFTASNVNTGKNGMASGLRDLQMVSSEPTKQSDGTALENGDIWIDSNELEAYPKIYRYNTGTSAWVLLDNTDQSSASGIVFGDAVGDPAGTTTATQGWGSPYASFNSDAVDPANYAEGTLLFNTRVSGYNVKEYKTSYIVNGTDIGPIWINAAGNKADGSPFMGRKAQRQVVVTALQSVFTSNDEIRADSRFFNLIACPGYAETYDEMIALNTARKETAFIIVDAPFRLKTPSDVSNWMSNSANATTNGEDGLVSGNTYSSVYYPSALTTDLAGNNVVVPASHIALRTIAFNDNAAFQWFAPAGYQRGLVTNASSVGYIDSETGEYNSVVLSEGSRDTLYSKKVNPIAFMPNRGLVVFGQKTLHPVSSALDRVNVARLIVYLRYQFDQLAKPFLFELNDRMTRDQVTDTFERFLADLASKRALFDFLVVCDDSNNTPTRIDANQMWIDVAIQPAKAAEFIYIPIRIKNTGENMSYS